MESQDNNERVIRLYVAGDAPSSRDVRRLLTELTSSAGNVRIACEVVDVLRNPARALHARLLATPTLIVENGSRSERFVGQQHSQRELARLLDSYRQG